jgi:hypothetical protein
MDRRMRGLAVLAVVGSIAVGMLLRYSGGGIGANGSDELVTATATATAEDTPEPAPTPTPGGVEPTVDPTYAGMEKLFQESLPVRTIPVESLTASPTFEAMPATRIPPP